MDLTPNARRLLEARYLLRDATGRPIEDASGLVRRVARCVAGVEPVALRESWEKRFVELMERRLFLPNSPTLMNAGKAQGQLAACFVLPVPDELRGIFETLKNAALIHQSGGGTGFAFSRVRPKGGPVSSTSGVASGPVSFIRMYDSATETIRQGGARRGANMGILRVDHPDIRDFVRAKRDQRAINNFNLSVGVSDRFMRAVAYGDTFELRDPSTGSIAGRIPARELFLDICESAWQCGDPGLVFLDRLNRFNPTPGEGEFESTNPCGEQPLLPYESCNLGSMNLAAYVQGGSFDWDAFSSDIADCVRFLDNVIDANFFPIEESGWITRRNRKIGLGVMGFADTLLLLGIPYDSEEGFAFGERIAAVLDREAKACSIALAREKGPFPAWKGSLWDRLGFPPLRNATVTTVAPTGSISMLAGCSSGIEPIYAGVSFRNVLDGQRLQEVHPAVQLLLREKLGVEAPLDDLTEDSLAGLLGPAWRTAGRIPVEAHVRMQAVFQRFSDSAVSKTVNLPRTATREDVEKAYLISYKLGCKGITVYRDQSRGSQVLEAADASLSNASEGGRDGGKGPSLGTSESDSGSNGCPSC